MQDRPNTCLIQGEYVYACDFMLFYDDAYMIGWLLWLIQDDFALMYVYERNRDVYGCDGYDYDVFLWFLCLLYAYGKVECNVLWMNLKMANEMNAMM